MNRAFCLHPKGLPRMIKALPLKDQVKMLETLLKDPVRLDCPSNKKSKKIKTKNKQLSPIEVDSRNLARMLL